MTYSAKKPYQTPSKDYVRHLKQMVGPESVFEKPYQQPEYGDMNQAPNTPTVIPPIGGTGELKCLYDSSSCEITVGCYAGPGIRVTGGPEEADSGYQDPKILQGAIINWAVQEDDRAIEIILDPSVARNVVEVEFIDGWGKPYIETVDIVCTVPPVAGLLETFTMSTQDYNGVVNQDTSILSRTSDALWPSHRNTLDIAAFMNFTPDDAGIPQGATITEAYIEVVGFGGGFGGNYTIRIRGEDADTATFIEVITDFTGLSLTAETVGWSVIYTNFTDGAVLQTPDISAVIQEIVDRSSYDSGNIQIVMDVVSTVVAIVQFSSKNRGDAYQPVLYVSWEV